jgi:hypothetical protein
MPLRRLPVTEGDVCYTYYTAPAGVNHRLVQEGDLVVLNRGAERLILCIEVPMSLLPSLGAPVGETRGRLVYSLIGDGASEPSRQSKTA